MAVLLLLKDDRRWTAITTDLEQDVDDALSGIRCPLCGWRPSASSVWCCNATNTPEPPFPACGAMWNTFATRGRCPGCGHQWRWTTCLRCHEPSLHETWYEDKASRR
jgi:hypothetical protein